MSLGHICTPLNSLSSARRRLFSRSFLPPVFLLSSLYSLLLLLPLLLSPPSFLLPSSLVSPLLHCSADSAVNPFLADSVWPIAQQANYAQASTKVEGPVVPGQVDTLFHTDVAGALTVLYTPDEKVVWGSSLTSVFKVDRSGERLRLIDSFEKPEENRRQDTFRGIYSVLTKEGVFYISSGNVVSAFGDKEKGNSLSGISHLQDYDFSPLAKPMERVLALSLSFDGHIVICTNRGGIGILTRDLKTLLALEYSTAARGEEPRVDVTNSVSIDEFGGIYIVTSRYMHRMWWDSENLKLISRPPPPPSSGVEDGGGEFLSQTTWAPGCLAVAQRLCQVWSTSYPVDDEPIEGRPTKEGSGTTPSLLRDERTERLYVMIADGQRKQEVMAIDSVTGKIVASEPVNFNSDNEEESYTEQSILVSGNKFLVTQNALTAPGQRINDFLETIHAIDIVEGFDAPEFVQANVYLLPVLLGDSPRGFQQFELSTEGNNPKLTTTWTRSDLGCPNSIPTMSESTNVMYCVGKKNTPITEMFMKSMSAGWTIEAFNWDDGETVFRKDVGSNLLYNSLYAATQIGVEREIIYGCIGGLVRLRSFDESRHSAFGVSTVIDGINNILYGGVAQTGGMLLSAASQAVRMVGSSTTSRRTEAVEGHTEVE